MIAKILIYGDIHLCSKNYGGHNNYPQESLEYFRNITKTAEEMGVTHIIGLGDLTFGRFNSLEYRKEVEDELIKQYNLTKGNRFELKGNHDSATYGMTEYEYYVEKGLIKPSTNLQIGKLNLSMIDNGQIGKTQIIPADPNKINVLLVHDYVKFEDTDLPNYGEATILNNMGDWFGIDFIIAGHIHGRSLFEGYIISNAQSHKTFVHYPGCPCRPAYIKNRIQTDSSYAILTVDDNGEVNYQIHVFELWPVEKSFNLAALAAEKEAKELKHIDVSDIAENLNKHERIAGDPEEIIMSLTNFDLAQRQAAIELLHKANS